jgi:hypothetical protein
MGACMKTCVYIFRVYLFFLLFLLFIFWDGLWYVAQVTGLVGVALKGMKNIKDKAEQEEVRARLAEMPDPSDPAWGSRLAAGIKHGKNIKLWESSQVCLVSFVVCHACLTRSPVPQNALTIHVPSLERFFSEALKNNPLFTALEGGALSLSKGRKKRRTRVDSTAGSAGPSRTSTNAHGATNVSNGGVGEDSGGFISFNMSNLICERSSLIGMRRCSYDGSSRRGGSDSGIAGRRRFDLRDGGGL